jgi:hypothetical protein
MNQINLYDKRYFEFAKYLGWILFFVLLWFRGCSDDPCNTGTKSVVIPEVKGKFETKKPINLPISKVRDSRKVSTKQSNEKYHTSSKIDSSYIFELQQENELLSRAYYFANDSVKKLMFEKANQLNSFSQTFDDQNVKIDVSGISRGTVESLSANYTIKEREVKQKEVKFRLLSGATISNSIDLQNPVFSANLGLQNKRGNVLRFGYDTQKRILVGYDFSIFKIER